MTESIVDDIDTCVSGMAKIKVFGVGGAGSNAVQNMIDAGVRGVQFICANTDMQALNSNKAPFKVQLGEKLTKGLGAGADPEKGRAAAEESANALQEAIGEADMIFITAGMGGGTGTGAAPIVAELAKRKGVLTVGVVTKPFAFEGPRRMRHAEAGLAALKPHVDSLIVIPNERLIPFTPKGTKFNQILKFGDDVLLQAVKGISEIILYNGLINLDFADMQTAISNSGLAHMGIGAASGENRAQVAVNNAIHSHLLDDISLESAKSILYNIRASHDITGEEVQLIGEAIGEAALEDTNIIVGLTYDDEMGDEVRITLIATGIESPEPFVATPVPTLARQPLAATVTNFSKRTHEGARNESNARHSLQRPLNTIRETSPDPGSQRPWGREDTSRLYEEAVGRAPFSLNRSKNVYGHPHAHKPGHEVQVYKDDDFEVPTFLRRNMD